MKLLFATTNQGKLKEGQALLSESGIDLLSLVDFPQLFDLDVDETGDTFEENAFIKAKTYGDLAKTWTIAEDAGLVVSALPNQLGVKSARFAPTSQERNEKLIKVLEDKEDRSAQFVSVFCLYDPQTQTACYFRGEIKGQIATKIQGGTGFDYDFVFMPEGFDQTFSQLGKEIKNSISHRHQALEKLQRQVLSLECK